MSLKESDIEKKKMFLNLAFPALLLAFLWLVKIIEVSFDISFANYGIDPLHLNGLLGIAFSPFIHGDFRHLINNSIPLFILGWALFYFYHRISWNVILLIWIFSGLGTWFIGRPSYHIGASGVIYGLFTFLFFSGVIRKNKQLSALSMLVIFLYGSMVWGIFPGFHPKENISWEGHLAGALVGIFLAVWYRKEIFFEENSEEGEEESEEDFFMYRCMSVRDPFLLKSKAKIRVKMYSLDPKRNVKPKRKVKVNYQIHKPILKLDKNNSNSLSSKRK